MSEHAFGPALAFLTLVTRAADFMTTKPIAIPATSTVGHARRMMMHLGLRCLLVLDDEHHLIGLLSDRALLHVSDAAIVSAVMVRDPIAAAPDDDLGAIARLMSERSLCAMPVLDRDGALVGVVTYLDVLRRLAAEHRAIET